MTIEILGSHMPTITRLLEEREHLKGDLAEFGVYAGATTVQLAGFDRFVWAFDTFRGIPIEDYTPELDVDGPGKFMPQLEIFDLLAKYKNIMPVVGRFEDTLPDITRAKIVLAYLDCDLYLSAKCALEWLADHLVPGGVIVLDDYEPVHAGIQRAVDEFVISHSWAKFDGAEVIYWGQP